MQDIVPIPQKIQPGATNLHVPSDSNSYDTNSFDVDEFVLKTPQSPSNININRFDNFDNTNNSNINQLQTNYKPKSSFHSCCPCYVFYIYIWFNCFSFDHICK